MNIQPVRLAADCDIPRMVEMGRQFHAYAGIVEASFDPDSFARTLKHGMQSADQAYFVAEVDGRVCGMTGGVVYPSYFNHSALAGQEMFWWSDSPGVGRGLYLALEKWAVSKGCKSFTMIALADERSKRMDKVYKRMGYRPSEHCYIKGL